MVHFIFHAIVAIIQSFQNICQIRLFQIISLALIQLLRHAQYLSSKLLKEGQMYCFITSD